MSREQNLDAQDRFTTEVINGGNIDVLDKLVSPDFVDHDPAPDQGPGPNGLKAFWTAFRTAFPDLSVTTDQTVVDDDYIAMAYRATGTQRGPLMGIEPTGKSIDIRGLQITRFEDGFMVERWGSSDQVTLLQQIGALKPLG